MFVAKKREINSLYIEPVQQIKLSDYFYSYEL